MSILGVQPTIHQLFFFNIKLSVSFLHTKIEGWVAREDRAHIFYISKNVCHYKNTFYFAEARIMSARSFLFFGAHRSAVE